MKEERPRAHADHQADPLVRVVGAVDEAPVGAEGHEMESDGRNDKGDDHDGYVDQKHAAATDLVHHKHGDDGELGERKKKKSRRVFEGMGRKSVQWR